MFQILNQEHTKKGEGGFLVPRSLQSNFGIFAWMSHESPETAKDQYRARCHCTECVFCKNRRREGYQRSSGVRCRINRGWMGLSVEGGRICQEGPELNAD